jgi:hypothetical protein
MVISAALKPPGSDWPEHDVFEAWIDKICHVKVTKIVTGINEKEAM